MNGQQQQQQQEPISSDVLLADTVPGPEDVVREEISQVSIKHPPFIFVYLLEFKVLFVLHWDLEGLEKYAHYVFAECSK